MVRRKLRTRQMVLLAGLLMLACHKPPPPLAKVEQPQDPWATLPQNPTETTAQLVLGAPLPEPPTVTFALPQGEIALDEPIVLAFSQPMVPLRALDLPTQVTGITLNPPVPMRWRWLGTDTLSGQPVEKWPHATEIQVKLEPSLRTRAGQPLPQPFQWTFHTAPPLLEFARPLGELLARDQRIHLVFNQPVDLAELRAHLRVSDGLPPWKLLLADQKTRKLVDAPEDSQVMDLVFQGLLPSWQKFQVTVLAGLPGLTGTLRAPAERTLDFATSGPAEAKNANDVEPFELKSISDEKGLLDPSAWEMARLYFSVELSPKDQTRLLKVTPPVKQLRLNCYGLSCGIHGEFQPAQTYHVALGPQLQDAHGRKLGKPIAFTRRFGHRTPELTIETDGTVLELRHLQPKIAVSMRNLQHVQARAWRLPPETSTLVRAGLEEQGPGYAQAIAQLGQPTLLDLPPNRQLDEWENRTLDLGAVLSGQPGAVWLELTTPDVVVRQKDEHTLRLGRLYQVTDLHVTVESSTAESLFWVTALQTGLPVAGAKVEVRDELNAVLWRGTTNAEGLVLGPGEPQGKQYTRTTSRLVQARTETDAVALQWIQPHLWWGGDGTDNEREEERGWLFTDKPVYRRGETLQIKGLLRLAGKDGLGLPPAGREGKLELRDPLGRMAAETTVRLTPRGTFATALTLPGDGDYGGWDVRAQFGQYSFSHEVQMAVYHVPRTRLDLTLHQQHVTLGEEVHGKLTANWFSGGPLEEAPAHLTAAGGAEDFAPPGWEKFQFGRQEWQENDAPGVRNLYQHETRGKTDAHGQWTFHLPTRVPMDRDLRVEVDVAADDPNGRSMTASQAFWLHPAAVSLGMALPSTLVQVQKPLLPQLIAVTPDGHAQAGLSAQVQLVRREWKSIRRLGMGGETQWETRMVETPSGQCALQTLEMPVECTLVAAQAGLYVLRGLVRDHAGRQTRTALELYAYGGDAEPWDPENRELLVLDKKAYKVGEVAHILVKNPVPGAMALVTEERAGIVRTRLQKLEGRMPTLDIPIEPRHAPNMHVGVIVIGGRRSDGALGLDTGAPLWREGEVELTVDPGEHRLQVVVTPEHRKLQPGQKTSVEVQVRDVSGRPRAAEVTLWAVDEGVLALTGEKTPDPFATLYRPIEAGVRTMALMDDLVRKRAGEEKGATGGGGGEGQGVREAMRDVAFWQAAVEVGADGKARHTFTLPDNLTTWRVMAVAVDGPGDFGSGDAQIEVSKPLMLQPAVPKSVAEGDTLELTATLRNRTDHPQVATVTLHLEGPMALTGPAEVTATLAPQHSQEVKFQVRAGQAGQVALLWKVTAGQLADAVKETLEVKSLQPLQTVASWAEVPGNRVDVLHKAEAILPDRGELDVQVASSLTLGARVAVQALLDYPFECSEQIASRLQGVLALMQLDPAQKDALGQAQKLVDKLEQRATSEGGVRLWEESSAEEPATLWTLLVLAEARAQGLKVHEGVLKSAANWLRTLPQDPRQSLAERSAALAAVGLADPVTLETEFARRTQLDLQDTLWLALAYVWQGEVADRSKITELTGNLLQHVRVDGEHAFLPDPLTLRGWDSPVQLNAMLLELLAHTQPHHPLLPRLTRWLARQQGGHGWLTTHANAWALRALLAVNSQAVPPEGQIAVKLGQKTLLQATLKGLQTPVLTAKVPQVELPPGETQLAVQRQGQGPVWLRLAYSYAPQTPPQEGKNAGILVQRRVFDLNGQPIAGHVKRGETVVVQIELTAGDFRDDIVVVDRPPAGLEPVDLQFASRDAGLQQKLAALGLTRRDREEPFIQHREYAGREVRYFLALSPHTSVLRYLARAATRGQFQAPGTQAESMYHPEIFGTSGAVSLRID